MTKYTCHPQVLWAVETTGVNLILSDTGDVWTLGYPDAAIWDLISRRYSLVRAAQILAAILSVDLEPARQLLLARLEAWIEEGILVTMSESKS